MLRLARIAVAVLLLGLSPGGAQILTTGFGPGKFVLSAALSCSNPSPVLQADYNVAYTGSTPSASGGAGSNVFTNTGSPLPTGMTISSSTGVISGTDVTDSGGAVYAGIQITVTDLALNSKTCGSSFTITVYPTLTLSSYTPVQTGTVGTAYTGGTPTVTGGATPLTYSFNVPPPAGLACTGTCASTTGILAGTPTTPGTTTGIILTVTDNIGQTATSSSFQIAVTASAITTPVLSWNGPGPSNSTTNYCAFIGVNEAGNTCGASTTARQAPMPVSGAISNLYYNLPSGVSGGSYTITLYVNGASTALTCTVSSGTSCFDTSDSVSVSAGQTVEWVSTITSSPASNSWAQLGASFLSTNANESFIIGAASPSTSAVNYYGFNGLQTAPSGTEANVSSIMPAAGTLDQLYVAATQAAGSSKTWTITIFQNGTYTAITCNFTGTVNKTCSDLSDSITVGEGDTISVQACPGTVSTGTCTPGTAPNTSVINVGMRWKPTTAGQTLALMTLSPSQLPDTTHTYYMPVNGGGYAQASANEANALNVAGSSFTIKLLTAAIGAAPGGSSTRTLRLRAGTGSGQGDVGTPGNLSCTFTSAVTVCPQDTTNTYGASSGTFLDWETTVSGTNAAVVYLKIGAVVTVP